MTSGRAQRGTVVKKKKKIKKTIGVPTETSAHKPVYFKRRGHNKNFTSDPEACSLPGNSFEKFYETTMTVWRSEQHRSDATSRGANGFANIQRHGNTAVLLQQEISYYSVLSVGFYDSCRRVPRVIIIKYRKEKKTLLNNIQSVKVISDGDIRRNPYNTRIEV